MLTISKGKHVSLSFFDVLFSLNGFFDKMIKSHFWRSVIWHSDPVSLFLRKVRSSKLRTNVHLDSKDPHDQRPPQSLTITVARTNSEQFGFGVTQMKCYLSTFYKLLFYEIISKVIEIVQPNNIVIPTDYFCNKKVTF